MKTKERKPAEVRKIFKKGQVKVSGPAGPASPGLALSHIIPRSVSGKRLKELQVIMKEDYNTEVDLDQADKMARGFLNFANFLAEGIREDPEWPKRAKAERTRMEVEQVR